MFLSSLFPFAAECTVIQSIVVFVIWEFFPMNSIFTFLIVSLTQTFFSFDKTYFPFVLLVDVLYVYKKFCVAQMCETVYLWLVHEVIEGKAENKLRLF